jgi:hypothetical protein
MLLPEDWPPLRPASEAFFSVIGEITWVLVTALAALLIAGTALSLVAMVLKPHVTSECTASCRTQVRSSAISRDSFYCEGFGPVALNKRR